MDYWTARYEAECAEGECIEGRKRQRVRNQPIVVDQNLALLAAMEAIRKSTEEMTAAARELQKQVDRMMEIQGSANDVHDALDAITKSIAPPPLPRGILAHSWSPNRTI